MIKALKEGGLEEAGAMLFSNNPMSLVCSLVCNHERQCEGTVFWEERTAGPCEQHRELYIRYMPGAY